MLVDDGDRVLLAWRYRFVQDRWGWELPGGLVDEDEEPCRCVARELEEQTGYRAGRVERLIAFQPMPGMVDSKHVVLAGCGAERVGEAIRTSDFARMEWIPLASIPELIAAEEIWSAESLMGLLGLRALGA